MSGANCSTFTILAFSVVIVVGSAQGRALAQTGSAPLTAPGDAAMTDVRLLVADVDANTAFWVTLGDAPVVARDGGKTVQGVAFGDFVVLLNKADHVAPAAGSGLNHIGLHVPDVQQAIARWKAAGLKTQAGLNPQQAFVWSPDDLIQVEILEAPAQTVPATFHHVHIFVHANAAGAVAQTQAWYARTFAAIPGKRSRFDNDTLPGGEITFNTSDAPTAPSKGRAIDSIGISVKGLQAYCAKLRSAGVSFDAPYTRLGDGTGRAAITDPWGDRIELTEAPAS